MAVFNVLYDSIILERSVEYSLIIPENVDPKTARIFYLLHGYTGDHQSWLYKGNVLELSEKYQVIFLMPNAYNSFYLNHENGEQYYDYLSSEVINHAKKMFNLGDNFYIAGLSMGGYGALALGLKNPMFKAIGAFSGALDITPREALYKEIPHVKYILDSVKETDLLVNILKERKENVNFIYQYCGKTDFLLEMNLAYQKPLETKANHYLYKTDNRGHEWSAWRDSLDDFIKIILENNY